MIEHSQGERSQEGIIRQSLRRHVLGLARERRRETSSDDRERRAGFVRRLELEKSFAVLLSVAKRHGLAAEADLAERRVQLDEIERRSGAGR